MLQIQDLTVDHGAIRALNAISFTVAEGKLAAVIGSNGAGKTTLMRTLSGLKSAASGEAIWRVTIFCTENLSTMFVTEFHMYVKANLLLPN